MHSSTSSLRPRQRTFTSCTECRRRKQRCNQAKDRPCNNCARRYPPVACTYEGQSTTSTHIRPLDYQIRPAPDTTYMSTSQTDMSTPITSSSTYYPSSSTYYTTTSTTRPEFRTYPGEATYSSSATVATNGDYITMDMGHTGYYSSDAGTASYTSTAGGQAGYYSNVNEGQSQGDWYMGDGTGEYGGGASGAYYYLDSDGSGAGRR